MNRQDATNIIKTFPETPGVYFFRAKPAAPKPGVGEILYIGKATSLRDRVKSYWANDIAVTRGPKIVKMLLEFDAITFEKTDSVLEALLLESYLIKKYQPEYNTKEKDNKSFHYVVITKEDFPRVLLIRGRDILISALSQKGANKNERMIDYTIAESFGPFPSGSTLREALVLIRKIFPFRDKCVPCLQKPLYKVQRKEMIKKNPIPGIGVNEKECKPCFNRQIGLCPGVCTGEISKEEYQKTIYNIVHFFRGQKKVILRDLEKQMKLYAKGKYFEDAGRVKKQIFALTHIHDISLIKEEFFVEKSGTAFRIESYDIAHMGGENVVGVMTVVENGEISKNEYRKFKIKNDPLNSSSAEVGLARSSSIALVRPATGGLAGVNDTKALKEVVSRRLGHIEWRIPDLIVVDGGIAQKRAVEKAVREAKYDIPVVSVVKDERHKPKEILGDKSFLKYEKEILLSNAEAHRFAIGFHKILRNKNMFQ